MLCYECAMKGVRRDAVGMCHHCSAGLCEEHARMEASPVEAMRHNKTLGNVSWEVQLARPARELLCSVCQGALHQEDEQSEGASAASPALKREPSLQRSAA